MTNKKKVYVVLAFHAHEPLWDLPGQLQKTVSDHRIIHAMTPEHYLRKRAKEGRNVYRDMLALASALGAPITMDITNELLHQIRDVLPSTFEELARAYQDGLIHPLYTTAHHTHAAFLTQEELLEEIDLNAQFLHDTLGASEPAIKGFFFTEASVDRRFLPGLKAYGIDYIVFPHLHPGKSVYTCSDPEADYVYKPFLVEGGLIALPRHFPVSQEIWRPITRWYPEEVKYQGYLMGQYAVFDTEYASGETPSFPISRREAIVEYTAVLRQALKEAPDGGLILYIQDLELMDFGEAALEILEEAWDRVTGEGIADVHFVTPQEYVKEAVSDPTELASVSFERISWAPEIRLVARSDGHYPPLGAGEFRGLDTGNIYRNDPFVFWSPGRFLTDLCTWLVESFGYPVTCRTPATVLSEEGYLLARFPYQVRLPLHLRFMKRACNWGWRPDEGRVKRPYLHAYMLADCLLLLLKLREEMAPKPPKVLDGRLLEGLSRLPELTIDPRVAYLKFGLERQQDERQFDPSEAFRELDYAKDFRAKAEAASRRLIEILPKLDDHENRDHWMDFLLELREHCRNIFLASEHIQRAWGHGGDVEFLVVSMYKYLYDIYPPIGPEVMAEVWGSEGPPP